jgi:hypothetical protein
VSFYSITGGLSVPLRAPFVEAAAQLFDRDGFDVIAGGAQGVGALDVAGVFRAAQHRNIERWNEMPIANPSQNFESGERRDLQVEKNQVGVGRAARLNGFQMADRGGAVDGMNDIAGKPAFFERPSKEKSIVFRIFDQENEWA